MLRLSLLVYPVIILCRHNFSCLHDKSRPVAENKDSKKARQVSPSVRACWFGTAESSPLLGMTSETHGINKTQAFSPVSYCLKIVHRIDRSTVQNDFKVEVGTRGVPR